MGVIVKRLFSTAVLGLAAAALSITPAIAAPPEPVPTVPGGVTLTECGFDVHATRSGKVKFLFLEVDGLVASLQRTKPRRRTEEKLLTVHEGWKRRHPSSEEYVLVNKHYFRTQDKDFWEAASRFPFLLRRHKKPSIEPEGQDHSNLMRDLCFLTSAF